MKMHLALLMAATIAFSAHADDDDKGFGAAGVLSNNCLLYTSPSPRDRG